MNSTNEYCRLLFLRRTNTLKAFTIVVLFCLANFNAIAQSNPFSSGWELKSDASTLRFQSVKKTIVVESSSFADISGGIDSSGFATVKVQLDSVDTDVDLRNVRMRFLFFETFKFPQATVTVELEPSILADLSQVRRKIVTLPYTLDLHGFENKMEAEIVLTQISDGLVSVSSSAPISISVADFGLEGGIKKLESTANVSILPSATVTFDFLFSRMAGDAEPADTPAAESTSSNAVEPQGDFSVEACKGRFEILSQTGNIYFQYGSARLDPESRHILDSIADIIRRCPGLVIEVSGHTDSDGAAAGNQRLSEARADTVSAYLLAKGIESGQIMTFGYGESKPIALNDTDENKQKNRRIEFAVIE